jgi:hypothetical protein
VAIPVDCRRGSEGCTQQQPCTSAGQKCSDELYTCLNKCVHDRCGGLDVCVDHPIMWPSHDPEIQAAIPKHNCLARQHLTRQVGQLAHFIEVTMPRRATCNHHCGMVSLAAIFHQPPHTGHHAVTCGAAVALHVKLKCMCGNLCLWPPRDASCPLLLLAPSTPDRLPLWPYTSTRPPPARSSCSCRFHFLSALLSHAMPAATFYRPSLQHCQESCSSGPQAFSVHCCHACSSVISLHGHCSIL